jgi:RNA polymerase sigma-54 factor
MVLTEVIQQLDPIGVGARDLRECLLLQAKHYFPKDDLVHELIDRHLENLEKRNVPPILKDLDCDIEDLQGAMVLVRELEPKPGRNFAGSGEDPLYVTPDVYVVKLGEEYLVQLNEDGLPKLKISSFYQKQIKAQGRKGDKREKEFIQDKFKSAVWLIRSNHQRQQTIRKVTESIVRFQRDFLDRGVEHLRPLILRQVADDIGMHESTISRVTTAKYVHTPQGIFELKYFFNSRITSNQGADLASESVKQKIKKYIGEEDDKKPLSDQRLCKMLEAEGMTIARRTVAKYREMMNIAPSAQRKKVF